MQNIKLRMLIWVTRNKVRLLVAESYEVFHDKVFCVELNGPLDKDDCRHWLGLCNSKKIIAIFVAVGIQSGQLR